MPQDKTIPLINDTFRLNGIDPASIGEFENGADYNDTISNNLSLDVINAKRTNVTISSYTITLYKNQPMHIYCGEGHIFMKSQDIVHRIELNGVKQLQSNNILT